MGEIAINPIHNVHKQYRKMNLVNSYIFTPPVPAVLPFVSTWDTTKTSAGSSTATQVKLPLISTGVYNFVVNWGDGNSNTITAWNDANTTHTYTATGVYTVSISGVCKGWSFDNAGDKLKILSVQSWGILILRPITEIIKNAYFYGCANLTLNAVADVLDLSEVTSFSFCFRGCSALTTIANINLWNTINVNSMSLMFQQATSFNQALSFDTSSVTDMQYMFYGATVFNQALSFNTASVINMQNMFHSASAFNQNIGGWNTVNVINMRNMFNAAVNFNQNIGGWNLSKVTDTTSMFYGATNFNNGGSSTINNWDVSKVITTDSMFYTAYAFNQNIASWNTISVVNMQFMFLLATAFNQNIGGWNTVNVTNMQYMFYSANAFNQDIGGWNVSKVSNFTSFMFGKTAANFSATNLDAIYNGWSSRAVKTPITILFNTIKYTSASSAGRAILTGAPNNWVITDGGI